MKSLFLQKYERRFAIQSPPKAVSTAYSFGGSAQDFDGDHRREG